MWNVVKTSSSIEDYRMFLDEYPGSRFGGAARFNEGELKRLWTRGSPFSPYEPDAPAITELSRKIGADLILMYRYGWVDVTDRKPFYAFLIDARKTEVYAASDTGFMDNAEEKIRGLTSRLLEDFFKKQAAK